MIRWKSRLAVIAAAIAVLLVAANYSSSAAGSTAHPATGVGSCTLKNWNPSQDPDDAKDLPEGDRPQSYKPDDYDCSGAVFTAPGVEFTRFPQPMSFAITDRTTTRPVQVCTAGICDQQ